MEKHGKRKRVLLTVADKLEVCRLAKQNVPKSLLMNQYNIGKSTLNDILRNEDKLKKFKAEKEGLGIPGAAETAKQIKGDNFEKVG